MGRRNASLYVEPTMPKWWDHLIIVLTVFAMLHIFLEMGLTIDSTYRPLMHGIDYVLCSFFLVDFFWRFTKADRKRAFFKKNWYDLLGAIPVGPFKAARFVRLIRIVRLTRVAALGLRLARRKGIQLPGAALRNLAVVTGMVWLLVAAAFYYFERDNENIEGFDDALWWSITTLSTVGYGDLYPDTDGGRIVAGATMVFGIGVLGTLAATVASAFINVRERARKGLRGHMLKDHLLVLGWNAKSRLAISEFHHDPRFRDTEICILAECDETPVPDDEEIKFVRGNPSQRDALVKASADQAAACIVFARDPTDARSDHETTICVYAFRRLNTVARVSAELVDDRNREHLVQAGCDSIVDVTTVMSNLLVRSVQDIGVSEVVTELLSNSVGSEIYRIDVPEDFMGKTFLEYAHALLDDGCCLLGIARNNETTINPDNGTKFIQGDEVFVVSRDPISDAPRRSRI